VSGFLPAVWEGEGPGGSKCSCSVTPPRWNPGVQTHGPSVDGAGSGQPGGHLMAGS
jgi:hypothetical protein